MSFTRDQAKDENHGPYPKLLHRLVVMAGRHSWCAIPITMAGTTLRPQYLRFHNFRGGNPMDHLAFSQILVLIHKP
jgi:hypothetical protein